MESYAKKRGKGSYCRFLCFWQCSPEGVRLCGANMMMEKLERRCTRDHSHVPIQGKFTRPSSVYVPKLAKFLASFIRAHLEALEKATERLSLRTEGLEDVLSNDVRMVVIAGSPTSLTPTLRSQRYAEVDQPLLPSGLS